MCTAPKPGRKSGETKFLYLEVFLNAIDFTAKRVNNVLAVFQHKRLRIFYCCQTLHLLPADIITFTDLFELFTVVFCETKTGAPPRTYLRHCPLLCMSTEALVSREKLARSLRQKTEEKKRNYLGHTLRINDDCITKQVLQLTPQDHKERVRPKNT